MVTQTDSTLELSVSSEQYSLGIVDLTHRATPPPPMQVVSSYFYFIIR